MGAISSHPAEKTLLQTLHEHRKETQHKMLKTLLILAVVVVVAQAEFGQWNAEFSEASAIPEDALYQGEHEADGMVLSELNAAKAKKKSIHHAVKKALKKIHHAKKKLKKKRRKRFSYSLV